MRKQLLQNHPEEIDSDEAIGNDQEAAGNIAAQAQRDEYKAGRGQIGNRRSGG